MKKKGLLSAGGVLVVVGLLFSIIGAMLGGKFYYDFGGDPMDYTTGEWHETRVDGVTDVEVDLYAGYLKVVFDDSKAGTLAYSGISASKISLNGGTLAIKDQRHFVFGFDFLGRNKVRVTLYLPEKELDRMKLEVGAGKLELSGAQAKSVDLSAGAGEIFADGLVCSTLKVDCGAGKAQTKGVEADTVKVNCGVGQYIFEGNAKTRIDIDGGVGDTVLSLTGPEEQYSYNIDQGLGSISMNGSKLSSGFGGTSNQNGGSCLLKIDGGVGSVRITTK